MRDSGEQSIAIASALFGGLSHPGYAENSHLSISDLVVHCAQQPGFNPVELLIAEAVETLGRLDQISYCAVFVHCLLLDETTLFALQSFGQESAHQANNDCLELLGGHALDAGEFLKQLSGAKVLDVSQFVSVLTKHVYQGTFQLMIRKTCVASTGLKEDFWSTFCLCAFSNDLAQDERQGSIQFMITQALDTWLSRNELLWLASN
jgi:hypothetical protein